MNAKLMALAGALFTVNMATAADTGPGGGAGYFFSNDNENFTTRHYLVYLLPDYQSGYELTGAVVGADDYHQGDWTRTGERLSVLQRHGSPVAATNWAVQAGAAQEGGHQLLTFDVDASQLLLPHTRLELLANRDWVETQAALDEGIHLTMVGANLEQGLGPHVTVVGTGLEQWFSDGNRRDHIRLRGIYQPWLESGFTLQSWYRDFSSSKVDVGGAYFNPSSYQQVLLGFGYRRRYHHWNFFTTAGAGRQKVSEDSLKAAYLLTVGAENPSVHNMSFRLIGGYQQTEGFTGPGYRYHYVQAEWLAAF